MLGPAKSRWCPHRSWVPSNPEPLGVELKTAGDSHSGIMLRLEIYEGTEPMKTKEFSATGCMQAGVGATEIMEW